MAGYVLTSGLTVAVLIPISRTQRRLFWLHAPLFLLTTILTAFTYVNRDPPSYAIAFTLFTISWEELRTFFEIWQYQRILLATLLVLAAYLALAFTMSADRVTLAGHLRLRWAIIGVLAGCVAIGASSPVNLVEGIADSPIVSAADFYRGPFSAARLMVRGGSLKKTPYGATRSATDEIHILVIGESSRRRSWSLYGYSRPTTPYLETIRDETVFMDRATTDANLTVFAVPLLLTGIDAENFGTTPIHGNLVDLAKEAGYFTSWLVNNDAQISFMVDIDADEAHYPHSATTSIARATPPDGVLLPDLKNQLARKRPQFIGMHVFGSHMGYSHRYPASFARFGSREGLDFEARKSDQAVIDTYDNSILYTDWFLHQVIDAARALDVPATVVYLSDHGEELMGFSGMSGHGAAFFTVDSFEIPAFVWMNRAYRDAHPDKVAALAANAHKPIRTHDFFYSLADLMGIRWPGFVPSRSFASANYLPDVKSRYIAAGKLVARTE